MYLCVCVCVCNPKTLMDCNTVKNAQGRLFFFFLWFFVSTCVSSSPLTYHALHNTWNIFMRSQRPVRAALCYMIPTGARICCGCGRKRTGSAAPICNALWQIFVIVIEFLSKNVG